MLIAARGKSLQRLFEFESGQGPATALPGIGLNYV